MAKNQDGYLSAKESRRISKENRRITDQYEKRRKRRNVPESEYTTQMKDPANAVEFDNLHTYFFTDTGVVKSVDGVEHVYTQAEANGVMVTGERTINGASYYFKDWGGMAKNQWLNAQKRMVSGDPQTGWYYFGSDGKMVKSYYALLKKNSSIQGLRIQPICVALVKVSSIPKIEEVYKY